MLKRSHTRIFIVDDSAFFSRFVETEFGKSFPEFEIIGTEQDPLRAIDRIVETKPDVVTIDFEMPHMNGIEMLEMLLPKSRMISSVDAALSAGIAALTAIIAEVTAITPRDSGNNHA